MTPPKPSSEATAMNSAEPMIATPHAASAYPITLDDISHSYGGGRAVDQVTLEIRGGELLALLGPSGCGKSTLLRIISGFIQQSHGRVSIGERIVDSLPPNRREVGIVFQNYALFPHMTVAENIAYGLAARGEDKTLQRQRVTEMLATVRMQALGDRKPRQLSGGQQQRVALARALAVRPRVLLLDEPFAALDKNLRLDMQIEIKRLQQQFALTAILVTHDQDEAMSIADRIAVMNHGRIEQLDTPVAVYDEPQTLFVNNFIGSSNLLPGVVESSVDGHHSIRLNGGAVWQLPARGFALGSQMLVSVRPEQLQLYDSPAPDRLPVQLTLSLPMAGELIHELSTQDDTPIKVALPRRPGALPARGSTLYCGLAEHARPALFSPEP